MKFAASAVVPMLHNATSDDVVGSTLLATSSSMSALGDAGIVISFVLSAEARAHQGTRIIAFLAAADLLGELPVFGSLAMPGVPPVYTWHGPWCQLQAAGNWWAQMATWLWTMAYAHTVAAGVNLAAWRGVRERHLHALCWGLPAVAVGSALATGLLGRSDDGSQQCTVRDSRVSMTFYSLLWLALAYNGLVFQQVGGGRHGAASAAGATDRRGGQSATFSSCPAPSPTPLSCSLSCSLSSTDSHRAPCGGGAWGRSTRRCSARSTRTWPSSSRAQRPSYAAAWMP